MQAVVGGHETVGGVGPRPAREVGGSAAGLGDEECGRGVVPGRITGTDGDVKVPCRDPGASHAGAAQGAELPGGGEDPPRPRSSVSPEGEVGSEKGVLESLC